MNTRYRTAGILVAGALAVGGLAACSPAAPSEGGGESHTYTFATYIAESAPHGQALAWFFDEVEARSDGRVVFEPYFDGSLIPAAELLAGVGEDRADFAFLTPLYNPAELPLSQVTSIPFATTDVRALSDAVTELYAGNADYQREWEQAGVVPLNFVAVAPSMFAAKDAPVMSYEDLAGTSIRASGYGAAAVQAAGGNAVSLVVGELYESLERGLIDGYTNMIFDAVPSLSLQEVAPYISDTGLGTYGLNSIVANPQVWEGISEEDRAVIEEVIGEFDDRYFENLAAGEDAACDAVLEAGGEVVVWSDKDIDAWADLVGDAPLDQWKSTAAGTGADIDALYDDYRDALAGATESPSGMARCAGR